MKTKEEILNSHKVFRIWNEPLTGRDAVDLEHALDAMEEYANQFQPKESKTAYEFAKEELKDFTEFPSSSKIVAMLEKFASHPKWISVEDELPPEEGKTEFSALVFTIDSAKNHHLIRYDYGYKSWGIVLYDDSSITHWMLPTPPKQ